MYRCNVSNEAGSVVSDIATVIVYGEYAGVALPVRLVKFHLTTFTELYCIIYKYNPAKILQNATYTQLGSVHVWILLTELTFQRCEKFHCILLYSHDTLYSVIVGD